MGNTFFDIVKYRPKRSKFFFRIVIIWYFMGKMLSDSILDLWKCPNRKTHESKSVCFPVGALCEVQIWICQKSQKMDFPLYFQISRRRVWVFFQARKLSFLLNALYLPPKQLWGTSHILYLIIVNPYHRGATIIPSEPCCISSKVSVCRQRVATTKYSPIHAVVIREIW